MRLTQLFGALRPRRAAVAVESTRSVNTNVRLPPRTTHSPPCRFIQRAQSAILALHQAEGILNDSQPPHAEQEDSARAEAPMSQTVPNNATGLSQNAGTEAVIPRGEMVHSSGMPLRVWRPRSAKVMRSRHEVTDGRGCETSPLSASPQIRAPM